MRSLWTTKDSEMMRMWFEMLVSMKALDTLWPEGKIDRNNVKGIITFCKVNFYFKISGSVGISR